MVLDGTSDAVAVMVDPFMTTIMACLVAAGV